MKDIDRSKLNDSVSTFQDFNMKQHVRFFDQVLASCIQITMVAGRNGMF